MVTTTLQTFEGLSLAGLLVAASFEGARMRI
jgi:hypothetical protein